MTKDGKEKEEILEKQNYIEDGVCAYYEKLYEKREVDHTREEIREKIGPDAKKISEVEQKTLEEPIKIGELNECLKSTRNNVSPGVSGFSGRFYMFWKCLQYLVLGAIQQIF